MIVCSTVNASQGDTPPLCALNPRTQLMKVCPILHLITIEKSPIANRNSQGSSLFRIPFRTRFRCDVQNPSKTGNLGNRNREKRICGKRTCITSDVMY